MAEPNRRSAAVPNDLEAFWVPFTPNRAFKRAPRLIARAKDMHYAVAAAIRPGRTRLLWLETPANPMWEITDLAAVCELAHAAGVRVAVDNTVATPVLTRPFEHGADLVVHSASKYLNGHGDVLAGAVLAARRDPFWERIRSWRRNAGAMPGPFEAWLLQRGMRTLFLRVHRASETAAGDRHALRRAPGPGRRALPRAARPSGPRRSRPGRWTAGSAACCPSGWPAEPGPRLAVLREVRVFKRATSLGGVESLIEHRRSSEGPSSPVPDDLLRISAGIESPGGPDRRPGSRARATASSPPAAASGRR